METTTHTKPHFLGAVLLIAGCCIGGGMLGLPLITALSGFLPSIVCLCISWLFMMITGLLLVEVYLYYQDRISLVSMARRTCGPLASSMTWICFLLLFYSLLVAYVSGGASLITDFFVQYFALDLPPFVTALCMTLFLGLFVTLGTQATDRFNKVLMLGLLVTYFSLIVLARPYVVPENLAYQNWSNALFMMPPFIVSFGYHNLLPGLSFYLHRNRKAIRWAIIWGSLLPFFIYFLWEWVLLGLVPVEGEAGFRLALAKGVLPAQLLRGITGLEVITEIAELFSFFAITTSFLAVALSLTDFLADGLKMPKEKLSNRLLLSLCVLTPPLFFALTDPKIFLVMLRHAGGIFAIVLYGLLPSFMVWRGRYKLGVAKEPMVPGGKPVLVGIFLFAFLVLVMHFVEEFAR